MPRQLEIRGVDGELKKAAEAAIGMKPNFAYTLKEVAADMHHVFDLGYFSKATPTPEDTRDGVKLIIEVPDNCNLLLSSLACELSVAGHQFEDADSELTPVERGCVEVKPLSACCYPDASPIARHSHAAAGGQPGAAGRGVVRRQRAAAGRHRGGVCGPVWEDAQLPQLPRSACQAQLVVRATCAGRQLSCSVPCLQPVLVCTCCHIEVADAPLWS